MKMNITKSLFVEYMDLPKRAWRKANNKLVYKQICGTEDSEREDYIMWLGQVVEDVVKEYLEQKYQTKALDLMPSVEKSSIGDDDDEPLISGHVDLAAACHATLEALREGVVLLYQPTFMIEGCLVRADFMMRNGDGSYRLIESKAKANVRKEITDDGEKKPIGQVLDEFLYDVSFQVYVINKVLAQEGLPLLNGTLLAHLDTSYIKHGSVEIDKLLMFETLGVSQEFTVVQRGGEKVIKREDVLLDPKALDALLPQVKQDLTLSEDEFNKKYPRGGSRYLDYFGQERPFGTIMGPGISGKAELVSDLYYQGKTDIMSLTDAEKDLFCTKNGTGNAREFIDRYIEAMTTGKKLIHDVVIKEILKGFSFPICFYDYESICVPIPVLDGTHPYQHAVVQYSLHKYFPDGRMEHFGGVLVGEGEYSVKQVTIENNPNAVSKESEKIITGTYKQFLQEFLKDIGDEIHGSTFVVWHKGFENSRNQESAEAFPDLADDFLKINESTYDLKDIFAYNYYFDLEFHASASIKKVLPVMVPDMTYEGMEIGNGGLASQVLYQLIDKKISDDTLRLHKIKKLLLYCGQDSLAMVRIYEKLKEVV